MSNRERRQQEAAARQAARDARTDAQQLDRLVKAGHGERKEAERLEKRIAATTEKKGG